MAKKSNAGRPTKYAKKYCDEVIETGKQGLSVEAFAGKIGVCKQTVYTWQERHPEFLDACKRAEAARQHFWEQMGIAGTVGKIRGFKPDSWRFNMKNRFGWRDRIEHSGEIATGVKGEAYAKMMSDPEMAQKLADLAEFAAEED